MRSGNLLLGAVVMLTLFVARWGGRIVCGLDAIDGGSRAAPRHVDPDSEEGRQAARVRRDFEALQRAEAKSHQRDTERALQAGLQWPGG